MIARVPLGLLAAALMLSPAFPQLPPDTSVKAVTLSSAKYVTEYQQRLSFLLADEHSTQQVFDGNGHETARRAMAGELFVTFLPADRAWISVHDTAEVDGRPLDNREDLRQLLGREPLAGVARLLVNRNARSTSAPSRAISTNRPSACSSWSRGGSIVQVQPCARWKMTGTPRS